jgi:hypothetical protein
MGLIGKANDGDEAALRELRPLLDLMPKIVEQMGDLSEIAHQAWVDRVAGSQLAMAEALRRTRGALQAKLSRPADSPLERLLVDRVVLCWLHLHYAEASYAQKMDTLNVEWSDAYQRRIDRAQRRYLQVIRTLAQVRRLALPAVQVNIAGHQVNQIGEGVRTVA